MTNAWLNFVGGLVASLAWPVAALVIVLTFREEFRRILDGFRKRISRMRRATGPAGTSVEFFEDALDEARGARQDLNRPGEPPAVGASSSKADASDLPFFADTGKREQLKRQSPAAALLVVFTELEAQITALWEGSGMSAAASRSVRRRRSVGGMVHHLSEAGNLPKGFREVFEPVRRARNEAAHALDTPLEHNQLRELVDICAELALTVRGIRLLRSQGVDSPPEEGSSDEAPNKH